GWQEDWDNDGDEDALVEDVGVERRQEARPVDHGDRCLETEAEQPADDEGRKKNLHVDLERTGREHERRERKGRRNQIEYGECDRAALSNAFTRLFEPPPPPPPPPPPLPPPPPPPHPH